MDQKTKQDYEKIKIKQENSKFNPKKEDKKYNFNKEDENIKSKLEIDDDKKSSMADLKNLIIKFNKSLLKNTFQDYNE